MYLPPILVSLLFATALHAGMPSLLQEALDKVVEDTDRWAYTQTRVEKDRHGATKSVAVVRFDPSQPYAEQYTPLLIDGQPPGPHAFRKYRRQGERRGRRAESAERQGTTTYRKTLGEVMDLERAFVLEEDARSVTYEVPLKREGNTRFPPEKFLVTARVNKELRAFENVSARLKGAVREKLIIRISKGEGTLDFTPVAPDYPPQLTSIVGSGSGSVLFVPVGRTYEVRRKDFKRVTPYGDRFDVQIGPLKVIDF